MFQQHPSRGNYIFWSCPYGDLLPRWSRRSRCEAPAVFRSPASSLCSFVDAGPASIYPGGKDEIHQNPALPALFLPYSSLNHQNNTVRWVLSSCPLLSLDPHRLWKPASPGVHAGGTLTWVPKTLAGGTLTWVPKTLACKNLSTKGKLLEQKQIRLYNHNRFETAFGDGCQMAWVIRLKIFSSKQARAALPLWAFFSFPVKPRGFSVPIFHKPHVHGEQGYRKGYGCRCSWEVILKIAGCDKKLWYSLSNFRPSLCHAPGKDVDFAIDIAMANAPLPCSGSWIVSYIPRWCFSIYNWGIYTMVQRFIHIYIISYMHIYTYIHII